MEFGRIRGTDNVGTAPSINDRARSCQLGFHAIHFQVIEGDSPIPTETR